MSLSKLTIFFLFIFNIYTWKSTGHFLVAAICEKILKEENPELLKQIDQILNNLTQFTKSDQYQFIESASFLDDIKYIGVKMFNKWHYLTEPYLPKESKSELSKINNNELRVNNENIVTAINQMKLTLRNTNYSGVNDHFPKALALIMIIHFIGDIHQPLHGIARIDPKTLKNDAGGNDFIIKYNGTKLPLHSFWDETLREFKDLKAPLQKKQYDYIQEQITQLMKDYPRSKFEKEIENTSVKSWQSESYKLAIKKAYSNLEQEQELPGNYLKEARELIKERITLGGYRLAKTLQDIYSSGNSVFDLHIKKTSNSKEEEIEKLEIDQSESQSLEDKNDNKKIQRKKKSDKKSDKKQNQKKKELENQVKRKQKQKKFANENDDISAAELLIDESIEETKDIDNPEEWVPDMQNLNTEEREIQEEIQKKLKGEREEKPGFLKSFFLAIWNFFFQFNII